LTECITAAERSTLLVLSVSLLSGKTGTSTLRPQERPPAASVTPLLTPEVVSFRKDRRFLKMMKMQMMMMNMIIIDFDGD
jgi:hypothetical protein